MHALWLTSSLVEVQLSIPGDEIETLDLNETKIGTLKVRVKDTSIFNGDTCSQTSWPPTLAYTLVTGSWGEKRPPCILYAQARSLGDEPDLGDGDRLYVMFDMQTNVGIYSPASHGRHICVKCKKEWGN